MRQKSFLSIVITCIFSCVGFCTHAAAVIKGDVLVATMAALIYVFPLFVDAIEDLSAMHIVSMTQHRLLVISVIVGIVYMVVILAYWALQIEDVNIKISDALFRYILVCLPVVFTVSKLYDLRVAFAQNRNVAKAYCKGE